MNKAQNINNITNITKYTVFTYNCIDEFHILKADNDDINHHYLHLQIDYAHTSFLCSSKIKMISSEFSYQHVKLESTSQVNKQVNKFSQNLAQ